MKQDRLGSWFLALLVVVAQPVMAAEPYGVNAGDVLRVFVGNEETLSGELLVAPDGAISVNMIGRVEVAGLSTTKIENLIKDGLNVYLKTEPIVTVSLLSTEGNRVFVQGAVTQPGAYVLNTRLDVMQALALAGGFDAYANPSAVKVVRRDASGTQQLFRFDYDRFKSGKGLEDNILLQAGDVVVVP